MQSKEPLQKRQPCNEGQSSEPHEAGLTQTQKYDPYNTEENTFTENGLVTAKNVSFTNDDEDIAHGIYPKEPKDKDREYMILEANTEGPAELSSGFLEVLIVVFLLFLYLCLF